MPTKTASPRPRKTRRKPAARGLDKAEATRHRILTRALALFQAHGVEATTMRDIARACGLSLGAAYYHFPSKQALMFAYYEANQEEAETVELAGLPTVQARLAALLHAKVDGAVPHRFMLTSVLPHLMNPGDPLSPFSAQTEAVRRRALQLFARALDGAGLTGPALDVVAHAMWLFQLAALLMSVGDDTPKLARTHTLIDEVLGMAVPLLPLATTPMGQAMLGRLTEGLARADIHVPAVAQP